MPPSEEEEPTAAQTHEELHEVPPSEEGEPPAAQTQEAPPAHEEPPAEASQEEPPAGEEVRSPIGGLLHAVHGTRPDLAWATSQLARFVVGWYSSE